MNFPTSPSYGDSWTSYGNSYAYDGSAWVVTQSGSTGLLPTAPDLYPGDINGLVEWNTDVNTFVPVNLPAAGATGFTYERPAIADGALLKWDQTNNRIVAALPNIDYRP